MRSPPHEIISAAKDRALRLTEVWLFCTLLFAYGFIHQGYEGGTPTSRLDTLFAVVRFGTLSIDAFHENTPDKAVINGRYYSD